MASQRDISTEEIADYKVDISGGLIPALQHAQEKLGYLPTEILERISEKSRVPLSRIFGVVTFYSQFSLKPRGKHSIKICTGTACHVKGANPLVDTLKEVLNVDVGDTTEDRLFTLETIACIGTCFLAPVMMIDEEYYGKLDTEKVTDIIRDYKEKDEVAV